MLGSIKESFQVQFEGITGMIEFGIDGSPYNKMYEIVNFRDNGVLSVVGNWSSDRDPNLLLYRQVCLNIQLFIIQVVSKNGVTIYTNSKHAVTHLTLIN